MKKNVLIIKIFAVIHNTDILSHADFVKYGYMFKWIYKIKYNLFDFFHILINQNHIFID